MNFKKSLQEENFSPQAMVTLVVKDIFLGFNTSLNFYTFLLATRCEIIFKKKEEKRFDYFSGKRSTL